MISHIKLLILAILAIFFTICFLLSGCRQDDYISDNNYKNINEIANKEINYTLAGQSKDKEDMHDNVKIYKNERFGFSVEYPGNWSSKEVGAWEASSENESSPDGGIEIYPGEEESEKIYVYGQAGHISTPNADKQEKFTTNDGVSGTIYIDEHNGRKIINLILEEGFIGANINVSLDCYKQNEKKITDLLKSIKKLK